MMSINLLRKAALVLASALTAITLTAAPAAATQGWYVHSGGYTGDPFGDMPCLDTGAQLKANGTVQDYYCQVNNGNGLWDLWVIQGTWDFNSHYGDVFDCADAGYAQVSAHHAYTWECRTAGSHFDLYLILT